MGGEKVSTPSTHFQGKVGTSDMCLKTVQVASILDIC